MADWNHLICDDCWDKHGPQREPTRLKDLKSEHCCFCGNPTLSGIWMRKDPKDKMLACKGTEGTHKEESMEGSGTGKPPPLETE